MPAAETARAVQRRPSAQLGAAQRTDAKKWQSEKSSSVRGPRLSAAGAAAARASTADDIELSVSTSLPSAIATSCAWRAGVARKRIAWWTIRSDARRSA